MSSEIELTTFSSPQRDDIQKKNSNQEMTKPTTVAEDETLEKRTKEIIKRTAKEQQETVDTSSKHLKDVVKKNPDVSTPLPKMPTTNENIETVFSQLLHTSPSKTSQEFDYSPTSTSSAGYSTGGESPLSTASVATKNVSPKVETKPTMIQIDESGIKHIPKGDLVYYPNVNSCMTLTAILDNGDAIGTHLVSIPKEGQMTTADIIKKMKEMIGEKKVKCLYMLGARAGPGVEWNNLKTFFPNSDPPPKLPEGNITAFALAYFFKSEQLKTKDYSVTIDIKINAEKDELVVCRHNSPEEELPQKPEQLFSEDFSCDDLTGFFKLNTEEAAA